jgi:hypothetical protein
MTPTARAAAIGRRDVLRWMLAHRPFADEVNRYHWNLADLAQANRREALLAEVIDAGARPPGEHLLDRMRERGIPIRGE